MSLAEAGGCCRGRHAAAIPVGVPRRIVLPFEAVTDEFRMIANEPFGAAITVDDAPWYEGPVTTVLVGNVSSLFGGLTAFGDARPDDGRLHVGIVTADGVVQWARLLTHAARGAPERSPFVRVTQARQLEVRLDGKVRYELDGGDRGELDRFRVGIEPRALRVRVPRNPTPEGEAVA